MTLLGATAIAPAAITTRLVRGTTYVVLTGVFGPDHSASTERAVGWAGATAPHALVVDLVGVSALHAACAAGLERVLADLRPRLGGVPVVAHDPLVVAVLESCGITARHRVVPSLSAALAVLGGYRGDLG